MKPAITATFNKEERDYFIQWTKVNDTVVGSIKLHLSESLKQKYAMHTIVADLLVALKTEYDAPRISGVFVLFKELLDTKITQSSHPAPSLDVITQMNVQAKDFAGKLKDPTMDEIQ